RIQFGKTCCLTTLRSNAVEKIPWHGVLTSVQPRIRLGRSFDQRSHTYLGYALRVRGNMGSEAQPVPIAFNAQSSERLPLLSACARYGAGNTMRLERTQDRRWVREGVYTSITRNDALPSASLLGRGYTG